MKKFISLITVMLTAGVMSAVPAMAAETSYSDVASGVWYSDAVSYVSDKGLFGGTGNGVFSPEKGMTRGMFVTVMGRMAEKSGAVISEGSSSFSDVAPGSYYEKYIAWAADNGIVSGVGDGRFSPDSEVTREQMCKILVEFMEGYMKLTLPTSGENITFADSGDISTWALEYVTKAQKAGLVEGSVSDGKVTFNPKTSVNRAAAAMVFMRTDKKKDEISSSGSQNQGSASNQPGNNNNNNGNSGNGSSSGGGSSGGGGSGGTTTKPDTSNYTEEQIAEEKEIAGYLSNMLFEYRKTSNILSQRDQIVQESVNLLMDCMSKALDYRSKGGFMSSEYVRNTYSDQIVEFKSKYSSMNSDQVRQIQNTIDSYEAEGNIYKVLDYFGVSRASL